MLGYDYYLLYTEGVKVPLYCPIDSHLIVVGGSNSGKSTSVLYWIYKARKNPCAYYIADFKASKEFLGISNCYGEFEDCYQIIRNFYHDVFMKIPEGGNGVTHILLVDEITGLLTHLGMSKEGKIMADEIRQIMSSILMLGRSRKCFLWLSLQRYTATIFPTSSGAADNFQCCVGLGRLSVDGRKGLFAGEHLEGEENLLFRQGRGIVLIDGQPIKALAIPQVSKKKLLYLLQHDS